MRKFVIALSMVLLAATAFAAPSPVTVNGNQVTATVAGSCLVPAAFTLAFGAYDPVDTNNVVDLDGSTTWVVRCTKNLAVTVSLDAGSFSLAGVRRMSDGGPTERLTYQLYKDAARLLVWGSGAAGGPAPGISGTGFLYTSTGIGAGGDTLTIYGRVPAGQDVGVGNYADTVTATLNF